MDPTAFHAMLDYVGPALVIFSVGASLGTLTFVSKHFKLKTRELELEAPLHAKEMESRLRAMETRQVALEAAVTALMGSLTAIAGQRAEQAALHEAPSDPIEPLRLSAVPPPLRNR